MDKGCRVIRLIRLEMLRLVLSRKWLIVALAAAVAAYLATDSLRIASRIGDQGELVLAASAWDVHATGANSVMYVGYLLFTSFMLLVGDIIVADRDGFGQIVLTRGQRRAAWWHAKTAAIALASVATQTLFLVACLLMGAARDGLPLSPEASRLATYADNMNPTFAPVSTGTNMLARELAVAAYLSCAFTVVGILFVASTNHVRWRMAPAALALVALIADYVLVKAIDPYWRFSIGLHMTEGAHSPMLMGGEALSWGWSAAYFTVLGLVGIGIGWRLAETADL